MEHEDNKSNDAIGSEVKQPMGELQQSVDRNIRTIRKDRGAALIEDAQLAYKRKIEDQDTAITRLRRRMANGIDLSPDNTTSLVNPSNFDGIEFAEKDSKLALDLWKAAEALIYIKARYKALFGTEIKTIN